MTSLSEAYHGGRGGPSLRRLSLGFGGFLLGVLLVVASIVVATTDVYTSGGATLDGARELGGILGGVGVPTVFLGVLVVLPAGRRTRATSPIGASIAVLGVTLFSHTYPCQWISATCGAGLPGLVLETVAVYFFGMVTTFWCLFVGIANFGTRNDPGGTATAQVTKREEIRVVEVEKSGGGLSGIGFLSGTSDGDVQTQMNRSTSTASVGATDGDASTRDITPLDVEPSAPPSSGGADATQPAGSAGATTNRSDVDTAQSTESARLPAGAADHPDAGHPANATVGDRYCGNYTYFKYVRTSDGLKPYYAAHDEMMQDTGTYDEWFPCRRE